jgi:hypothetical protein
MLFKSEQFSDSNFFEFGITNYAKSEKKTFKIKQTGKTKSKYISCLTGPH